MKHLTLLLLTFLISSVNAQHNYKSIEGFEVFNVNDSLQGSHAMKLSDVLCGQTITLNGSSISPTYATSLGLCLSFGTQTASATNYVNGINTFIVNHSATGPNVNISYRTDVFLQCN